MAWSIQLRSNFSVWCARGGRVDGNMLLLHVGREDASRPKKALETTDKRAWDIGRPW